MRDDRDFYTQWPTHGGYLDPPYEVNGHAVRGGPGWAVMNASDLARFGHLVATRGNWKGEQLIDSQWLRGHSGGNGSGVAGERQALHRSGQRRDARDRPSLRDRQGELPSR